jgi:hypothetical protein
MLVEKISLTGIEAALRGMRNPLNSWDRSDTIYPTLPYIEDVENWNKFINTYRPDDENNEPIMNKNSFNSSGTKWITNKTVSILEKNIFISPNIIFDPYKNLYKIFMDKDKTVFTIIKTDTIALIGKNDLELCRKLILNGIVHSKFARMIVVTMDITASFDFWKEYDTYKVATVTNSCSTMHTITKYPITLSNYSLADLTEKDKEFLKTKVIPYLNEIRDDEFSTNLEKTRRLSKLNPLGFEQKRTVMIDYETLHSIMIWRFNHKLYEWRYLTNEVIHNLPYFKEFYDNNESEDSKK